MNLCYTVKEKKKGHKESICKRAKQEYGRVWREERKEGSEEITLISQN